MLKIAACVKDGVIVNVASYDEDTSQKWLKQIKSDFDEIIIADEAGIGWEVIDGEIIKPPAPEPVEPAEPVEPTELEN
jgi:hypothetical protein